MSAYEDLDNSINSLKDKESMLTDIIVKYNDSIQEKEKKERKIGIALSKRVYIVFNSTDPNAMIIQ